MFSPTERIILWRLAFGKRVTTIELIGAIWHPDLEPSTANNIIAVYVNRLRKNYQ